MTRRRRRAAREPPQPLRVGIVGYGLAGRVFHAALVAADPPYDLVAVVTRDSDRGDAGPSRPTPGAEVVPRPPTWPRWGSASSGDRRDAERDARRRGRGRPARRVRGRRRQARRDHRLLGSQLIELAESLGRPLTVYQNRRWDGDYLTASRLVRDGALGDVHTFESRFEPWKTANRAGWKAEAAAEEGGGILFDLGPHLVDQALHLFGPAIDVHAEIAHPAARQRGRRRRVRLPAARGRRPVATLDEPRRRAARPAPPRARHGRSLRRRRARPAGGAARVGHVAPRPGYGSPSPRAPARSASGRTPAVSPPTGARTRCSTSSSPVPSAGGPLPVDPRDALAALEVIEAARASAG